MLIMFRTLKSRNRVRFLCVNMSMSSDVLGGIAMLILVLSEVYFGHSVVIWNSPSFLSGHYGHWFVSLAFGYLCFSIEHQG